MNKADEIPQEQLNPPTISSEKKAESPDMQKLLEAVNEAAFAVRNGWVFFVGMMAFFFIAVAGVTHKDLLLNAPVSLPLVQIKIELTQFFQFAPLILVLMHFAVYLQYAMLARKTRALHLLLEKQEKLTGENRTHPLRLELSSYFFVQAMAGPARSPLLASFLKAMSWLTLGLFPLILLLFFQTSFLPYHDTVVTGAHRAYLIVDILVLLSIGIFTRFPDQGFWSGMWSNLRYHSINVFLTLGLWMIALSYAFGIATIPGSWLDKKVLTLSKNWGLNAEMSSDMKRSRNMERDTRQAFWLTAWLFEGEFERISGRALSWFSRNLIVTDTDLVPYVNKEREKANEVSLHLRGRDLRNARFDRSDLHRADMTGAKLQNASLVGANLDKIRLEEADLQGAILDYASMQGVDLMFAKMQGAHLRLTKMQGADLRSAQMQGADLNSAKMQGVNFRFAKMQGTILNKAEMQGADLREVKMQGAVLRGAKMQGAILNRAEMQGADLRAVELQGAVLSGAKMQGADLRGAKMHGAVLQMVNMRKAVMRKTKLQGAVMWEVEMQGAFLREAEIWQTLLPDNVDLSMTSLYNIRFKKSDAEPKFRQGVNSSLNKIPDEKRKAAARKRLYPLLDNAEIRAWENSDPHKVWKFLVAAAEPSDEGKFRTDLTNYLADLACKDLTEETWDGKAKTWDGKAKAWTALAIVQRTIPMDFKGDADRMYQRLTAKNCGLENRIPASYIAQLEAAGIMYKKRQAELKAKAEKAKKRPASSPTSP